MSKVLFSKKQQNLLKANPLIKNVSDKSITYTDEFRERFAREYETGKLPLIILSEMGIDTDILGVDRIKSLTARFKKMSRRVDGCSDLRSVNFGHSTIEPEVAKSTAEKLELANQHIALLKAEIDVIKKKWLLEDQERRAKFRNRKYSNSSTDKPMNA